jgi:hypothetical protein
MSGGGEKVNAGIISNVVAKRDDMAQIETTQEWVKDWADGRLAHVMTEMEALRQQHNGSYTLKLHPGGGGAFVYERFLPLPQLQTAVDFDEDFDVESSFEQFKGRVASLLG